MASELTVQTIKGPTSGGNANKILVPSGHTLDASSGDLNPPAGACVQVAEGKTISYTVHSTTSYTDSNLQVAFTPKYTNSKLLITVSGCYWWGTENQTSGEYFMARIVDSRTGNSVASQGGSHQTLWFEGNQSRWNTYDRTVSGQASLNNDGTLDARTYKVQCKVYSGNYDVRVFEHAQDNIIRVLEIKQ